MNILHLCQPFHRPLGSYRRIYELFHDDDNKHLLVSIRFKGDNYSKTQKCTEDIAKNIKFVLGTISLSPVLNRPPFRAFEQNRSQVCFVNTVISNKKFDIVYAHNLTWQVSIGARLASQYNVPFVVETHGLYKDSENGNQSVFALRNFVRYQRMLKRYRIIKEKANLVVCQTQMVSEYFKAWGIPISNLVLIPNGVDINEFNPKRFARLARNMRARLTLGKKIVFLYAGYLDKINGIDFMLKSLEDYSNMLSKKAIFLILGDGPLKSEVVKAEKRFNGFVRYIGTVEQEEMLLYYALSNVIVIPRPRTPGAENMTPLKLLETMAMDKLILASNVGGITEALRGGSGVLFEPDNKEDFLRKVSLVIKNYEKLHRKKVNRKIIIEKYNWELSRQTLKKALISVLSHR